MTGGTARYDGGEKTPRDDLRGRLRSNQRIPHPLSGLDIIPYRWSRHTAPKLRELLASVFNFYQTSHDPP